MPPSGVMTGWGLVWCYFFIGTAGLCGFTLMSEQFLQGFGVHGTRLAVCAVRDQRRVGFMIAFKDVRLSAMLTLVLEGLSVACILALSAFILFKHGSPIDSSQIKLSGFSLKGLDFAVVVCIFSLVGFEAASTMGGEARNPLQERAQGRDLEPDHHRPVHGRDVLRRDARRQARPPRTSARSARHCRRWRPPTT